MKGLLSTDRPINQKQFAYLLIALVCFVIAFAFNWYIERSVNLEKYIKRIEAHLHQQEEEVDLFFKNRSLIKKLLLFQKGVPQGQLSKESQDLLAELSQKPFTVSIFQGDSLIFWSNNHALPYREEYQVGRNQQINRLTRLRNGYYELIRRQFQDETFGSYNLVGLVPIKYEYELESHYLQDQFVVDERIPTDISLTKQVSSFPLQSANGQIIAYLTVNRPISDLGQLRLLLVLNLIGFFFLALFINNLAKRTARPKYPWLGAAFLITVVFGIRLISVVFNWTEKVQEISLFAHNFTTTLSSSLGDLIINIVLLLWVMIFFHKEAKLRSFDHLSGGVKFGLTSLNYFSILIGIFIITSVFKNLVFNTSITFDFDNVFNLDIYSLIAIIGVILLLIALFLFSHRMMLAIVRIGLNRHIRLAALGLATLSTIPFLLATDLLLPMVYLLLIAFVFILIFDLFVDSNTINFTWLVIWLVILSAFPSILLFKYNAYKDRIVRLGYAKELSISRDSFAENSLDHLNKNISSDNFIKLEVAKPFPFQFDKAKLKKQINKFYTSDNYLFYNYTYDIFAYNKYDEPAIKDQKEQLQSFGRKLINASPTSIPDLSHWTNDLGQSVYIMHISIPIRNNPDNPLNLFLEFYRNRRDQSKVYTELLVDKQYKNLKELGKYEYAVYKNRQLVDSEGSIYGSVFDLKSVPAVYNGAEQIDGERSNMIYNAGDEVIVVIGKNKEMFINAISLFSYIFGMLIALVLIFALLNSFTSILPNTLSFTLNRRPSLKNRIQLSVIALIVISFVIIGFVTVWFFQTSSEDYHEKRLERKTRSVLSDAKHELDLLFTEGDSAVDLSQIVRPLSRVHRMDINLYDLSGRLVSSSEEDIFNKGIISKQMAPFSYYTLSRYGNNEFVQETEKIGTLEYKSAYVPLKINTEQGEKTLGFLGLPYYSKQSKLRSDITVFMSTLLNVYVFLLLIAGGIAIAVANSITRPLAKIGDKLKQVKLGMRNEPLEWKSQDELGELIMEYNRMIKKLEDSADRLAQSEREGAWREMAKQVAHEIKNPLTPMKLSIQYLQHAFRSNPQDIEPLLKRVSGTLIEQIDNLAQIASEFSNFAKMPRAENQKVVLNQLVRSVFDLFSNECHDMDLHLNLVMAEDQFTVYADKNHLMRVLNNLLKNAIQAIPDGRHGDVLVHLYQKDNQAIIKVS
ncbi:MAG: histidine kinase dimerization/phospho-acceptor domain-containing protein, partial [Bacteroidota bacterium]